MRTFRKNDLKSQSEKSQRILEDMVGQQLFSLDVMDWENRCKVSLDSTRAMPSPSFLMEAPSADGGTES